MLATRTDVEFGLPDTQSSYLDIDRRERFSHLIRCVHITLAISPESSALSRSSPLVDAICAITQPLAAQLPLPAPLLQSLADLARAASRQSPHLSALDVKPHRLASLAPHKLACKARGTRAATAYIVVLRAAYPASSCHRTSATRCAGGQ